MSKKMGTYLLRNLPIIILVAVWAILVNANFTPNTSLSGWDNLHPEFDFLLNIKRSIFASWQEYQGLGLVGGMAHAADLPRQVLLWGASYLLPSPLLRYFWTFSMLLIGPLGVYFLVDRLILDTSAFSRKIAALVASLFYLLNLATVQYFFVPFEAFVSFYGFLPWLIFSSINYLNSGKRKALLAVLILHLIASTSFYVQTLFVVYIVILSLFLAGYLIRRRFKGFIRVFLLALAIVAANAYWSLPVIYFTFTNASVLVQAKQNMISTPETFYMNVARGDLKDIALLKGYWFDYYDVKPDGTFDYLFKDWMGHMTSGAVENWGVVLFAASVLGVLIHIFRRKKWNFTITLIMLLSYFMLATTNSPFGSIFESVSTAIPLFGEIFRNVFTKWSIVAALSYSLGLAFLVSFFADLLRGKAVKLISLILVGILAFGMFQVAQPVFKGNLISNSMKVELPDEYDELFNYFKGQEKNRRIAFFPMHTHWGWQFNSWGYRGSGFLWYAIEQPILHRSFDVWSSNNETFYKQASFALYESSLASFEKVLEKYNISHLLLDESVIDAGGSKELLYIDELKEMLTTSENIRLSQKYGFLSIYETNFAKNEPVFAPDSYSKIDADLTYARKDPVYEDNDTYQIEAEGITYPFVNFDKRKAPEFTLEGKFIEFRSQPLSFSSVKYLAKGELDDPLFEEPEVAVDEGKRLVATIPVNEIIKEDLSLKRGFDSAKNCDVEKVGDVYKENDGQRIVYRAEDGGVSCDYFVYEDISYKNGYILHIKGENKEGRSLKIYLQNRTTKRMDLEELLPKGGFEEYYFILPKDIEGDGYTLNLETRSFGDIASENIVEKIEFIPFPYTWLTDIKLVPQDYGLMHGDVLILNINKANIARYEVAVEAGEEGGLIVLDQAFEEGWRAYLVEGRLDKIAPFFATRELKHNKVNNWANGWFVPERQNTILILYLPQYLEYLGFLLLFSSFLLVILSDKRKLDYRLR